jgi:hypothetical protein
MSIEILTYILDLKGTSVESRWKSIEMLICHLDLKGKSHEFHFGFAGHYLGVNTFSLI